jgi:pimeloyl-ACP methyl ester carboxylesterase
MGTVHGLTRATYPANDSSVTAREIVAGGERVRIVEAGPANGFPVVLLHGWGGSAYNFRHVLPALGEAGLHAIAPDLRGHGGSAAKHLPRGAFSSASMSTWVKVLLDELGIDRCVLVGQSIGGAIALDAAAALRERVAALVLLAPIGFTTVRRVLLTHGPAWLYPTTTPRWVVAWVLRRIYGARASWSEHDVDEYWVPLRQPGVVRSILQSAREFDFTPRDPNAPVLGDCRLIIRFGELDGLISSRDAVAHAKRFEGADVAVLRGVGHVPAEEVPGEVVELVRRIVDEEAGGGRQEAGND